MRMEREGEEEEVWWDWDKTYNLKFKNLKLFARN